MYKPSTWYLVVTYFPTYVPMFETYGVGYEGETEYLTR
jgi:hypothetical protein